MLLAVTAHLVASGRQRALPCRPSHLNADRASGDGGRGSGFGLTGRMQGRLPSSTTGEQRPLDPAVIHPCDVRRATPTNGVFQETHGQLGTCGALSC